MILMHVDAKHVLCKYVNSLENSIQSRIPHPAGSNELADKLRLTCSQ